MFNQFSREERVGAENSLLKDLRNVGWWAMPTLRYSG